MGKYYDNELYRKIVDFFKVICFSGTFDIITAYPINNVKHLPYIELDCFVKENCTSNVKCISARDRFNKRFNIK